tara:strand:- start:131 stop:592 length:462 start_codon:yes stop_codon:yes gene_type:complete
LEEKLKKLLILICLPIIFFACTDEKKIYEIELSKEKINFPFEQINNGQFMSIYRNYEEASISFSLLLVNQPIMKDAQDKDFCEGVTALRNQKMVKEWIPINYNYISIPESEVPNQNDHPNLVSYNLPVGTYLFLLMDSKSCTRENHIIFDVKE